MNMNFTNDLLNPFNEHEVVMDLIANTQGEIYQVANDMGFDLEDFSDKYLNSDFCQKEMDCAYSVYQREFGDACMTMILAEFEEKNITILPKEKEPMYSVFWVGAMYRYLFYHLRKYSKDLSKEISFKKLSELFFELENCDTAECIEYLKDILYEK